eukprot:TRINITY_DN22092_c0_g1_i1.p1 TRINITY_DN22092_c0_g1~~TRINITY_DN22092_c0_g1_i1.p1  ORF type:complete len:200 (+),score=49.54 TRINITY_DN22092_c0_g1_i1:72-602(+)
MNWKNSKISEVAKEKIWKEHVRTESQYRNSKEKFSVNPYRLAKTKPVCENITKRSKRFLSKERFLLESIQNQMGKSANSELLSQVNNDINWNATNETDEVDSNKERIQKTAEEIRDCLLSVQKTPIDKYINPMTEAQEIGWLSKPLVPAEAQFSHALKSCDITRFAGDLAFSSTAR